MLEFTHPETKTAFEAVVDKDRNIYQPARDGVHGEYEGKLSNVPPKVAATMVEQGAYHLIRGKSAAPAKTAGSKD